MSWAGRYWHYTCDRSGCGKLIVPDDLSSPTSSLVAMQQQGRLVVARTRKNRELHYCSEACFRAHFHAGIGHYGRVLQTMWSK